jgi:uncharacterized protein (TIGR02996 family)
MTDAELAELLRLVIARPDDHEPLRVYADVLIERGDPRGELIVVQLERERTEALVQREAEIVDVLNAALTAKLRQPNTVFDWRYGFIDVADFSPAGGGAPIVDTLRQLGSLAEARRLRRIVFRCVEPGWSSLKPAIAMLARIAPQLRGLRELAIVHEPRSGDAKSTQVVIGELQSFARACPKLEALEVSSNEYSLYGLVAPGLRRITLGRATRTDLIALAQMDLPRIEELAIDYGPYAPDQEYGFPRLLQRAMPLHTLRLAAANEDTMHYFCEMLPSSAIVRSLRVLALRGRPLRLAAVRAIARAPLVGQLERFEAGATDPACVAELRAAFGERFQP